jgi:hypothetical protein
MNRIRNDYPLWYIGAGPLLTGILTRSQAKSGSDNTLRMHREMVSSSAQGTAIACSERSNPGTKYTWWGKRKMIPSMPQFWMSWPPQEKLSQGVAGPRGPASQLTQAISWGESSLKFLCPTRHTDADYLPKVPSIQVRVGIFCVIDEARACETRFQVCRKTKVE